MEKKKYGGPGTAFAIAMIAGAIVSGCASTKFERNELARVKKVAVVGFSVQERMPNTGEGVLASMMAPSSNNSMMEGLKPIEIAKNAEHARILYDELQKKLTSSLGWKVLSRAELAKSQPYTRFHAEKTKQPQMRPMGSGPNIEMFVADNIVESFLVGNLSKSERDQIIKQLGVDAVAIATVNVELINRGGLKKLVGAGELHPVAKVGFKLYNSSGDDPIWMDLNADGDEAAEGVEHALGFASVDAVHKGAVATTQSAFDKLVNRYRSN